MINSVMLHFLNQKNCTFHKYFILLFLISIVSIIIHSIYILFLLFLICKYSFYNGPSHKYFIFILFMIIGSIMVHSIDDLLYAKSLFGQPAMEFIYLTVAR